MTASIQSRNTLQKSNLNTEHLTETTRSLRTHFSQEKRNKQQKRGDTKKLKRKNNQQTTRDTKKLKRRNKKQTTGDTKKLKRVTSSSINSRLASFSQSIGNHIELSDTTNSIEKLISVPGINRK